MADQEMFLLAVALRTAKWAVVVPDFSGAVHLPMSEITFVDIPEVFLIYDAEVLVDVEAKFESPMSMIAPFAKFSHVFLMEITSSWIIVSSAGLLSAFPSYFSSGKCSFVTVSPRPSQQALSMREGVVPGTLVDIPFTHLPKHIFVNGELKSSLAVDESWKPAVHESKKNCRATGLRVIAVKFPASDVLSKHNLPIIEMHCNQSFVMAAGVCLSLGVTGLSVSQAEQACIGTRVALPCGY